MKLLRFLSDARRYGNAYIDIDGCLLHKMPIPEHVPASEALDYWMANLCATKVVWRRLLLLYFLKLLGVRLHLWTNRSPQHEAVTRASFGRHYALFDTYHYGAGTKKHLQRFGPCMDDEARNIGTMFNDMLVKPTRCGRDLLSLWRPRE